MNGSGRSWIKVVVDDWILIEEINLYETCALGGVHRLSIIPFDSNDPEEGWVQIYENNEVCTEPSDHARIFTPPLDFTLLPRRRQRITRKLLLEVQWNLISGRSYPEFDAIEFVGRSPNTEDYFFARAGCGALGLSAPEALKFNELISGGVLDRIPAVEIRFTTNGSTMKFPKFLLPSSLRTDSIDIPNLALDLVSPTLLISFVLFGPSVLEDDITPFHLFELYSLLDSLGLYRWCLELCQMVEGFEKTDRETIVGLLTQCVDRFEPNWEASVLPPSPVTGEEYSEEEEEEQVYECPFTLACLNRARLFFDSATVRERMAAMRDLDSQYSIPNYVTHQHADVHLHPTFSSRLSETETDNSLMMKLLVERVKFYGGAFESLLESLEEEERSREKLFDLRVKSSADDNEEGIECHQMIVFTKVGLLMEREEEGEGDEDDDGIVVIEVDLEMEALRLLIKYAYYGRIETSNLRSLLLLYRFAEQRNESVLAATLEEKIGEVVTDLKNLNAFDVAIQNSADQIDGMKALMDGWEEKGLISRAKAEGLVEAGLKNLKLVSDVNGMSKRLEEVEGKVDLVLERLEKLLNAVVHD